MSGESTVVAGPTAAERREESDESGTETVLDALGDPDCRRILRAVGPDALTATECSEACELSLSTTYRKLDRLETAGLLAEHLRIRRDGKHASQYRLDVGSVRIEVDGSGELAIEVDRGTGSRPTE